MVQMRPVVENVHPVRVPAQAVVVADQRVAAQPITGQSVAPDIEPAHSGQNQIALGQAMQVGVVPARFQHVANG